MKKSELLATFFILFVSSVYSAEDERAFNLFVDACINSGSNPELIQSGRAEIEEKKFIKEKKEHLEECIQAYTKMIQEQYQDAPDKDDDFIAMRTNEFRTAMERGSSHEQLLVIFRGNDLYFNNDTKQTYRLFDCRFYDMSKQEWIQSNRTICLGNPNIHETPIHINLDYSNRSVLIAPTFFNCCEFQTFGRIRGSIANLALGILLPGSLRDKFELTDENKNKFKQYTKDQGWTFQISATEKYDGGDNADVVDILKDQKLIGRYWIDESRNYICPLSQSFDDSGKLNEEYRSSEYFFHEKSNLWFPALDVQNVILRPGDRQLSSEYKIHPETLQFNEKISDNEFSIDLAEGSDVIDIRNSERKEEYVAVTNGTLCLAKNGYEPTMLKWLVPKDSFQNYIPPKGGAYGWVRIVFMVVGATLILAMICVKLKYRKDISKTSHFLFLILLPVLMSGFGCATEDSEQDKEKSISKFNNLSASPSVLNFGSVRSIDSPVKCVFELHNNGRQNISVSDIISGCGCTVTDIPHEPILPGEKVKVNVSINIYNRFSEFNNYLQIQSPDMPPFVVRIRGEIISDIWTNGQSLRCSVESKESIASTILTLYTEKYPNILFEEVEQETGVTLKEISRSTSNGETSIRFIVELNVEDKDTFTTDIRIVPKDHQIAPIIIPVICYRDKES